MDWNALEIFKTVYDSESSSGQKVEEILQTFKELREYRDDLKCLFDCPADRMPIIKGVASDTNQIGGKRIFSNVVVTEMPESVSPEIQKIIMRVAGRLGKFTCERWGIGNLTESGRRHLEEYFGTHTDRKPLCEESRGQHKVLEIDYDEIAGGEHIGYCVYGVTGILLD